MVQLLTRLDDRLHQRIKECAEAQGRSVNAIVAEALDEAFGEKDERELVRERARKAGLLFVPPRPAQVPTDEELREASRGAGSSVSAALEEERSQR